MKKYKFRGEPLKKNILYSRNNLESLNFHSQMKIKTFVTVKTITIGETLAHMQVLCKREHFLFDENEVYKCL